MIKHISFDLWLTLIKSHPEFKLKRAEFSYNEFNPVNFSLNEVFEVVRITDKVCDKLNEIQGCKVPAVCMYQHILMKLGNNSNIITKELIKDIKSTIDNLFLKLQPRFLNPTIIPMLITLKNYGYTLNISSNTGFIECDIMIDTLKNLKIYDYFDFCIFSDEISASKPSNLFFQHVYKKSNLEKKEILHIGDNYIADYEGAIKFGFKALHITNSQYTINDITNYLQEKD